MVVILRNLAGLLAYICALFLFKKRVLYRIRSQYYGHLVLEGAMVITQLAKLGAEEKKQVVVAFHPFPSNKYLLEKTKSRILSLGVQVSHFWSFVADGQVLLRRTFFPMLPELVETSDFNWSLSHADCDLEGEDYPFSISSDDRHYFANNLSNLSNPYIVVANRTNSYKKWRENSASQEFRNFDFDTLAKALISEGLTYPAVRIGFGTDLTDGDVIDARGLLAENPRLSFLLQLGAKAYFGADSGPLWIFLARKVPTAIPNMIPLFEPSPTDPRRMLVVPKLLFSNTEKRILNLTEMGSPEVRSARTSNDYKKLNISPQENSLDDVRALLRDWSLVLNGDAAKVREIEQENDRMRKILHEPRLPSISTSFINLHPEIAV